VYRGGIGAFDLAKNRLQVLGGVSEAACDTVELGLYLLHVTWVLVAIFCMLRAHKLRYKAPNEKNWDEYKRKLEEDAARAEKYLGIER
jgi:hypothetical protein